MQILFQVTEVIVIKAFKPYRYTYKYAYFNQQTYALIYFFEQALLRLRLQYYQTSRERYIGRPVATFIKI